MLENDNLSNVLNSKISCHLHGPEDNVAATVDVVVLSAVDVVLVHLDKLGGVPLHELKSVLVGQVLERLDDLGVAEVVLPQQAGLDVCLVDPFVHVSQPEG